MKLIDFLKHHLKNHHFFIRLYYEWRRLSHDNLQVLAWKFSKKLFSIMLGIFLLPFSLILHLAGFRRVTVFTDRIGHLAIEPDCLIKEQTMGLIPKRKWFILAPPGRVANEHLLRYWDPFFLIFRGRIICFILASMSRWGIMRHNISHYILAANDAQAAYRIYAQWGDRPPLLSLTQEDEKWGTHALHQLGLPDGAWFVCVHAREAGFSPIDEEHHTHRNGSIEATIPAMQEITRRGGWVIRIGDPTMKPLPRSPHVIDYAHHPLNCKRLDIILCAKTRFLLGNTSGIALVSSIFGVPCAIANAIPTPTLWFNAHDISLPKLLWSEHLSRHLRFEEAMAAPIAEYRYSTLFRKAGIRVDENSAEDIRDLAIEMLDRLDGQFLETEGDRKLQQHYLSLFNPGHYSYGAASHVGIMFLRRHRSLFATTNESHTQRAGGAILIQR